MASCDLKNKIKLIEHIFRVKNEHLLILRDYIRCIN